MQRDVPRKNDSRHRSQSVVYVAAGALALAFESRGLLLGESANPATVEDIRRIAAADRRVSCVRAPLTMQLGPRDILLNLEVEFRDQISAQDHVAAIDAIENEIRRKHPTIRQIYIEARRPPPRPAAE